MIDSAMDALNAAAGIVEARGAGTRADAALREALGISAESVRNCAYYRALAVYDHALGLLAAEFPAGRNPRLAIGDWSDDLAARGEEGSREASATMRGVAAEAKRNLAQAAAARTAP